MKKEMVLLLTVFFGIVGWHSLAVAQMIPVIQGEQVTLTLKLVNISEIPLHQVSAKIDTDTIPPWLRPENVGDMPINLPASSPTQPRPMERFSLAFRVDRQAPVGFEHTITLRIWEGETLLRNRDIRLKVLPRPVPQDCALGQNFPNPFNPETWIPYKLKEAADVTIRIYDFSGRLARTLSLGHQEAGFYMTREQAAYWDGTNNTGERVASGVYFYQLEAGNFSTMRKMLILK